MIDFSNHPIDQLIEMRRSARDYKNFKLSDDIRDYLDSKNVIIFDTKDGQEIYNTSNKTREDVIKMINTDKKANAIFDAWLYSMKSKTSALENKR